ncbi:MAG: hypothetical protein RL220_1300 [Bacteroidota bacterium]
MNLFYCADLPVSGTFALDDDESRHLAVMRLSTGDQLLVTNGKGTTALCEIAGHGKKLFLEVVESSFHEQETPALSIAIAPTKNQDRLEWFVEKAVEVGIHEIRLFVSEHSEKPRVNMNRLQRVAIAAMKQSKRTYLPAIDEPVPFEKVLGSMGPCAMYLAHCREDMSRVLLRDALVAGQNACVMIGPEGDFSPHEIQMATEKGATGVSLGNARLRTETAALVSVITFGTKNL